MNQKIFIEISYSVLKNIVLLQQQKTEKCMKLSRKNNYEIIYKNTFWMNMSKIDKLKVVKIVHRQFASNDN